MTRMMRRRRLLAATLCASVIALAACRSGPQIGAPASADTVFYGERIYTPGEPASAVAVRGETIVYVGDRAGAERYVGAATRAIELGERALLPGFIDAHGHLAFSVRLSSSPLYPPPAGRGSSIDGVVRELSLAARHNPARRWITGFGYDDSQLAERRHPTRHDLDRVSASRPVVAVHVSGHFAALNSAALAELGIDATRADPTGGRFRRETDGRTPSGVLEESALQVLFASDAFALSDEAYDTRLREALLVMAGLGFTTVQEGAATREDIARLRAAAAADPLLLDVVAYRNLTHGRADDADFPHREPYAGGFRVAGAKLILDGSPQGRTAWMTAPYARPPDGAPDDYRGYPVLAPGRYNAKVARLLAAGVPVLVHANGDAAIDAMLDGLAAAGAGPDDDHRSVIVHAQLARRDQLERAQRLGAIPSFFSAHPLFWGDWHRQIFGEKRAANISPTGWAEELGLRYTIHNDAPVVPPNGRRLLAITTGRKTRSGYVLGPKQRVDVRAAIRAMTEHAAWSLFEDAEKGRIAVGQQADLVVWNTDPATRLDRYLEVVATYSRGRLVWPQFDPL